MSLYIWAVIGIVVGFALAALLSRKFNRRIVPGVLIVLSVIVLGVARWAGGQNTSDGDLLQAETFIFGFALFAGVAGSIGWLIFARQRWAMIASGIVSVGLLAGLPLVLPLLARTVVLGGP